MNLKILVTGFKPFLGDKMNPSQILAENLARSFSDVDVLILPVEFGNSTEILEDHVRKTQPDYLLMLGQAAGRHNICLEKVGLNWIQSLVADESGRTPPPGKIFAQGDLALMSQFPIDKAFLELKTKGHAIEISFSAGTYVCNELYYNALLSFKTLKSVFIHLPLLPEQLKQNDACPALSLPVQTEVLESLVNFLTKVSDGQP